MKNLLLSCPSEIQNLIWKTYMSKFVLTELKFNNFKYMKISSLIDKDQLNFDYILKSRAYYTKKLINIDIYNYYRNNNTLHNTLNDYYFIQIIQKFKQNTNPFKNHIHMIDIQKEYIYAKNKIFY